jgi:acetaldehyde dehydrogenase/alcohol dehydrogenase
MGEMYPKEVEQEINDLVSKGQVCLEEFRKLNQEQVDYIVAKVSCAVLDHHEYLARLAYEETHRGVFEDKCTKNLFACEYVVNNMRHLRTCGIINDDPVTGITEIGDPLGVICGVTPVTNPTSTVIFKSLISLKTRNPIIFGFHPNAQKCCVETAKIIEDAAVAAGAPKNCVQFVAHPSLDATKCLMHHPGIATILATGGNAMVREAYSCGKPALGVGAGNVPAYVEKTCNVAQAANDILMSKAFDNGMVCASEQVAIIDKEIYAEFIKDIERYGAYFCNAKEKALLEKYMFRPTPDGKSTALFSGLVGHPAVEIAREAGFEVPEKTPILLVEIDHIGMDEPMSREKLSPVLGICKSKSTDDGFAKAEQMVEEGGLGHSACIHTANKELVDKFGVRLEACRIIWNSPTSFGGIGNIYNSFIPSMTLGCGSYGHNSVSGNVGAINLINIKRIGKRRNNMQWFKVPGKIYFERNSIQYLVDCKDISKVFIVSDESMVKLGFLMKIVDQLKLRRNDVSIQLFTSVEPDPDIKTVRQGVSLMNEFKPDTIIALGGGSVMDAAKGMWLFYENPDVNFDDIKQKFMDIRKRAFKFPQLGKETKLICIPTTSGTGSEVSPFAVISDHEHNKKYPLTDYSLTPSIAIIDPEFTTNLPAQVTADTGLDVLCHAVEAYVSMLASDFTDGLAEKAIELVFDYLPLTVKDGKNELVAREKMHNAATIAGMAFANAFLGIVHALAHKVGAYYRIPHGRIIGILLPYCIRYNGQVPQKLNTWPKYNVYEADKKYAKLGKNIGLKFKTDAEGVEAFAEACYNLSVEIGEKPSLQAQGVPEKEFMDNVEKLAYEAYEDQCIPANPRVPLVKDLIQILKDAYYGNFMEKKPNNKN